MKEGQCVKKQLTHYSQQIPTHRLSSVEKLENVKIENMKMNQKTRMFS